MNWENYEEITSYIYEKLGEDQKVNIDCYGRNCRIKGKSGVFHQFDVVASHSIGLHNYKTAIECKYWKTKVPKDTIMKLNETISDCSVDKGVIVSKSGFTPDAINFARFCGISLVELRQPTNEDWEGRIKDINITMHAIVPEIYDYHIHIVSTNKINRVRESIGSNQ